MQFDPMMNDFNNNQMNQMGQMNPFNQAQTKSNGYE